MGNGDRKSRKGKIRLGSFGVRRLRKKRKVTTAKPFKAKASEIIAEVKPETFTKAKVHPKEKILETTVEVKHEVIAETQEKVETKTKAKVPAKTDTKPKAAAKTKEKTETKAAPKAKKTKKEE
jgi:30S ribosomal protein S31